MNLAIVLSSLMSIGAAAAEPVAFHSPGFPPSTLDAQGRLVEDWAAVGVHLRGAGVTDGPTTVAVTKLDDLVPAAQAVADRGTVKLTCTAYRAPAFPSGLDVLAVRVEEAKGQAADVTVALDLPARAQLGSRTVRLGARTVLTLPADAMDQRQLREWGYCDEATTLRNWAKPQGKCDPAFRNIRAGLGGVPILYRFTVKPKSAVQVALGFCESHWAERGKRPVVCRVEGAPPQTVDPVAKWGQHKPGVLLFPARDANGDGRLEVAVLPGPAAPDRNPILNAIWLFAPGAAPNLDRVLAGDLNAAAVRYVAVGGDNDQSIYPPGKLEYHLVLPARGAKELTFLVACQGSSAPIPDFSTWTPETLRRAAREVWRDWPRR
jgi:hypothetical protein